mgnify:FL=1
MAGDNKLLPMVSPQLSVVKSALIGYTEGELQFSQLNCNEGDQLLERGDRREKKDTGCG